MITARIITVSDSCANGTREDRSGPALRQLLTDHGYAVGPIVVVPDDGQAIGDAILAAAAAASLVATTGGTGIAPRDVTPEATLRVCDRVIPGFGELMRARSLQKTAMAALARVQAATLGPALVVNLPGSVSGAVENLEAVLHLIPHALELLAGGNVERHPR